MKNYFLLPFLLFQISFVAAQDFEFGRILLPELTMNKYDKDTTAHAVVLQEYGEAYISSSNINLIFSHHVESKYLTPMDLKMGILRFPCISLMITDQKKLMTYGVLQLI